jgi:hypothetical protein
MSPMKKFLIFSTLFFPTAYIYPQISGLRAQEDVVVENHINAVGGMAAFDAVKSIEKEGTQNYYGNVEALKITFEKDKLLRYDVEYNGKKGYWMVSNTEAGEYFPWENSIAVKHSESTVKSMQGNLQQQDPLMNYKKDSSKLFVIRKDTLNNKICSKILLTTKQGNRMYAYWIDDERFMIIRMERYYTIRNKSNDKLKAVDRIDYSDYRKVGNLMIPFAEKFKTIINKITVGEKVSLFNKIEINKPVNPALYHIDIISEEKAAE